MEKYFDAFLYLANWGTHVVKLCLPARLLDAKTARLYWAGERALVRKKNGKALITFVSEDEEGGGDWVEGNCHLSSLISVRAELGRGDLSTSAGCFARRAATSTMTTSSHRCQPVSQSSAPRWRVSPRRAWRSQSRQTRSRRPATSRRETPPRSARADRGGG